MQYKEVENYQRVNSDNYTVCQRLYVYFYIKCDNYHLNLKTIVKNLHKFQGTCGGSFFHTYVEKFPSI